MKKQTLKCRIGTTLLLAICLSSCIDTDTVQQPIADSPDICDELTISFSAPESFRTRASSDHKLRYVALLYDSSNGYDPKKFLQRKEIIEDADISKNVITFTVPQGNYWISTFADYIPIDSEKDENGFYNDCYYDTHSDPEKHEIKIDPSNYINNPNYDCFLRVDKNIKKTEKKVEIAAVLSRITAKVRFVDENADPANFAPIHFSHVGYMKSIYLYNEEGGSNTSLYFNGDMDKMSNPETGELFFFYTPASSSKTNTNGITFELGGKKIEIGNTKIPIRKNYITTVKGKFMPEPMQEPEPDPDLGDDIILNLTTDQNWESEYSASWD